MATRRSRGAPLGLLGLLALALAGCGQGVNGHAAASPRASPSGAPTVALVSRQEIVGNTTRLKAELLQVSRMAAKLTTWSTLQTVAQPTEPDLHVPTGETPTAEIWVVAVSGKILPEFDVSNGVTFAWAVYIYDAHTGNPESTLAGLGSLGPQTTWPPFFDALPDLSSPS
jgi:hypothetical protein